jgi:hypothetical protein
MPHTSAAIAISAAAAFSTALDQSSSEIGRSRAVHRRTSSGIDFAKPHFGRKLFG